LLIGALVFAFYSFHPAPIYFNNAAYDELRTHEPQTVAWAEGSYTELHKQYEAEAIDLVNFRKAPNNPAIPSFVDHFRHTQAQLQSIRDSVSKRISTKNYSPNKNDTNYIFLYFVKNALPVGIVGLLFAVIILASWGSISAALNSLTACSLIDVQLLSCNELTEKQELHYGRLHTLCWGIFCI
jgi:hypothetical protein